MHQLRTHAIRIKKPSEILFRNNLICLKIRCSKLQMNYLHNNSLRAASMEGTRTIRYKMQITDNKINN